MFFYSAWKLEKSIREIARVVFVHAESLLTNHPGVDCGVSGVNIIHKELGEKYLIALGWYKIISNFFRSNLGKCSLITITSSRSGNSKAQVYSPLQVVKKSGVLRQNDKTLHQRNEKET